jgi:hypothetical protein
MKETPRRRTAVTSSTHCKKDPIDVFPEMKLSGLIPNSHVHVSVSDLYNIICCSKIDGLIVEIYKSLTDT